MVRMYHHLDIARLEFFHAAFEHNAAMIDENEIGQHILHFFHLMRRHQDRAATIEIIVQQRVVELFPI